MLSPETIQHPTLLINEAICRANLRRMVLKAKKNGAELRPHFKTHQSVEIGKWAMEEGIRGITVSSVRMAQAFAKAGWQSITIAFPANLRELEVINQLASITELRLLINNSYTAEKLAMELRHPVRFYIEIDSGQNRSGLAPDAFETMDSILQRSTQSSLLSFHGFYSHPGHTYSTQTLEAVTSIYRETESLLLRLKNRYQSRYSELKLAVGDTPGCSRVENLAEFDELSPGNFIFYDVQQLYKGACSWQDIALAVACPVVDVYPARNEAIIYGGAVHFSKDFYLQQNGSQSFGQMVWLNKSGWNAPIMDAYLKGLSQEHGILTAPKEVISKLQAGQLIGILPPHSCLTADLLRSYYHLEKGNTFHAFKLV